MKNLLKSWNILKPLLPQYQKNLRYDGYESRKKIMDGSWLNPKNY
nr:MAG TPA: hypothetical protein [Caudoviricetes sp.]